jgi:nitroimidazol reductase NimA-like FMN-containing flavoprotein (pyridoxamine 5'-phosphate oxidase superfamily)
VIVRGTARILENHEERLAALDALMRKYQPEGGYGAYMDEKLSLTCVVCIDIKEMTGKSNDVDGLIR